MARKFILYWGVLAAVSGIGLQPVHAGDRKPAADRYPISLVDVFPAGHQRSSRANHGSGASGSFEDFDSKNFRAAAKELREKERGVSPVKERKQITLFHFDSKLGDVSVEPVVGQVNGAQMSVNF